jgi:hypothetical protein
MSAEIIVAEWPKNSRELLRVRIDEFMGQPVICVRAWYPDSNGIMMPGKGGLTIGIKHLPALADSFNNALAAALEHGLLVELDGNNQ